MVELTPEDEKSIIREIALSVEPQSREGDTFCIMNQRWWQHWLEYVNQDQHHMNNTGPCSLDHSECVGSSIPKRPCEIDNSDLLDDTPEDAVTEVELQDALVEGRDYVLLPENVWNQLFTWYGGGPSLARKVINCGMPQMELAVEVYPLRLHLYLMPKNWHSTVKISKKETIGELHGRACAVFAFDSEKVCMWDYCGRKRRRIMNDYSMTLDDANIQMDQDILVEVCGLDVENGCMDLIHDNGSLELETSIPAEHCKSSSSVSGEVGSSKNCSKCINTSEKLQIQKLPPLRDLDRTYGISTRGSVSGLTGLLNLGNTCFMNSAIQCLVHTPEFTGYFKENFYREINWQNPLGMVGELALAFGDLVRKLWAPGRTPVAPRAFKTKLARFAPQFSGYNQHDSQELLAFLLDGLHEDLNRVRNKPYIKSRDADGRSDEDVANEYWASHVARNDSVIVDVCQGQYKSTLICPFCSKISVTFDPFMYLSLPLQSATTRMMTVTVFTCDGSALPVSYIVTIQKQGRCRDLIQALGSACSLKDNEVLLLAHIQGSLIGSLMEDTLVLLSTIKDDDCIAAYRIPKLPRSALYVQLIHFREEPENASNEKNTNWKAFGTPLVAPLLPEGAVTTGQLQSMAVKMLFPFLRSESACCGGSVETEEPDRSSLVYPEHELPLKLIGENNEHIDLSEDKSEVISSSPTSISLCMYWSGSLLDEHDASYLENLPEVYKSGPMLKKARTEPLSLYSCLQAFLREEPLVPEDMWYCPQCQERRQASKKLDLWRLPRVLVIHLKRFSYSRSVKHKLETFVTFPLHDFDLTEYVAHKSSGCGRHMYELYGTINHYGSMGSGHYTAHIKLLHENRWYTFDDSLISSVSEDDVKSSAAYVLFYRVQNTP